MHRCSRVWYSYILCEVPPAVWGNEREQEKNFLSQDSFRFPWALSTAQVGNAMCQSQPHSNCIWVVWSLSNRHCGRCRELHLTLGDIQLSFRPSCFSVHSWRCTAEMCKREETLGFSSFSICPVLERDGTSILILICFSDGLISVLAQHRHDLRFM